MFRTHFDEQSKLWSGATIPQLFNANISIAQVLLRSMKIYGTKVAQISDDSGTQLTFEELRLKTIRASQHLQNRGYKPKQVIGVMSENVPHLSPIVFASFCLGCPVNVLSTSVQKPDVLHMLRMTEPSVMFCDVSVYDLIKECLGELGNSAKIFTFNGTKGSSEAVETLFKETGVEEDFLPVEVDGINDVAAILCSSGTTGPFKGVCLSHATLLAEIVALNLCTSDDVLFAASSLQWISGYNTLLLGTICGATRIITTAKFSPELQLRVIPTYKVSLTMNLPYQLVLMLKTGLVPKTDFSSIKHIFLRGHKASNAMVQEFNSYLPNGSIKIAYGMTEMSGIFAVNLNGSDSEGQPISGYSVKVVDSDGNRCGINTEGEICNKSPYKFLGYYRNPELSAQALDSEGFFLTGDIGYFDEHGNIHLIDRKKDLIAVGYTKISPSLIEQELINSVHIKAVCVVAVQCDLNTELPAAVVVRAENSQITEDEVCKIVEDNMTDIYKLHGGVYFVDAIPTTPSGKLLRRWARELAAKLFTNNKTVQF